MTDVFNHGTHHYDGDGRWYYCLNPFQAILFVVTISRDVEQPIQFGVVTVGDDSVTVLMSHCDMFFCGDSYSCYVLTLALPPV